MALTFRPWRLASWARRAIFRTVASLIGILARCTQVASVGRPGLWPCPGSNRPLKRLHDLRQPGGAPGAAADLRRLRYDFGPQQFRDSLDVFSHDHHFFSSLRKGDLQTITVDDQADCSLTAFSPETMEERVQRAGLLLRGLFIRVALDDDGFVVEQFAALRVVAPNAATLRKSRGPVEMRPQHFERLTHSVFLVDGQVEAIPAWNKQDQERGLCFAGSQQGGVIGHD